jgi:flavin reductase (DIM6/NTAB) family NADH-FMN oxidoreductase RutF
VSLDDASAVLKGLITYGLYVIGAKDENTGEVNGMTANWLTQISFEPKLVALAVENDAHTHQLISSGRAFSVNILEGGEKGNGFALMEKFTQPQERAGDKLGGVDYYTAGTGTPILRDAIAWFECELHDVFPAGDHTLFIGRVIDGGIHREGDPLTLKETGWDYGG